MMEHYVTLFDSLFLPQGLALHASMERHASPYTLWVLCIDNETHDFLTQLDLPNVRLLRLDEWETEELRAVKPTRTKGEYCWTLTPFAPRFVFEADGSVQRVTYVDADVWFRKSPVPIFKELDASGKHVLITEHAYAPEFDLSSLSGQFCVQFITFSRVQGEPVRRWWEERCVEWCFNRPEEGKFGDQKYLDDWPERFPEHIHVLANKEWALAPWNATRFPYGNAIFWHFHSLRVLGLREQSLKVDYGSYPLPITTRKNVYALYLGDLQTATGLMTQAGITVRPQAHFSTLDAIKAIIRKSFQYIWAIQQRLVSRF